MSKRSGGGLGWDGEGRGGEGTVWGWVGLGWDVDLRLGRKGVDGDVCGTGEGVSV